MALPPTGLYSAVAMLTRLPQRPHDAFDPVRACAWFPVVGGLVGGIVAAVLLAAGAVLPATVAALVAVAVEVLITGALHLDGLADCADGSAGRDREHRLTIMRDHAVGVYGATALFLALGLRIACLAALLDLAMPPGAVAGLVVAAWAISRGAMLLPARLLPYARAEGTGRLVIDGLGRATAAQGTGTTVLLALSAGVAGAGVAGAATVAVMVAGSAAATVAGTHWARRRLGGATGDVLGAVAETSLVVALTVAVAVAGGTNS